jgi:DNA-binding CsgD family transcriptional regulator
VDHRAGFINTMIVEGGSGTDRPGAASGGSTGPGAGGPSSPAALMRDRLARLPGQARGLLEAMAVLNTRASLAVVAEIGRVEDPTSAIQAVVDAGLARWWPVQESTPVEISDPWRREVIYEGLSATRRRALHTAAVRFSSGDSVWAHRVAATDRLDHVLAAQLDEEAVRHLAAGKADRTARILLSAAEISVDRQDYERRLLAAATHLRYTASDSVRLMDLKRRVEGCAPCAMRGCALGRIALAEGQPALAEYHLRQAEAIAALAHDRQTTATAAVALGWLYASQGRTRELTAQSRTVLALDGGADARSRLQAGGFVAIAEALDGGPAAGLRKLDELGAGCQAPPSALVEAGVLLTPRGVLRSLCGQLHQGSDDLATAAASSTGRPEIAARLGLAVVRYLIGAWDEAVGTADETLHVAEADLAWAAAPAHAVAALVEGSRGRPEAARQHLVEAGRSAGRLHHQPSAAVVYAWAQATLAEAYGDSAHMMECLGPVLAMPEKGQRRLWRALWLPTYAKGLIQTRRLVKARNAVAELRELADEAVHLRLVAVHLTARLAEADADTDAAAAAYELGSMILFHRDDPPLFRAQYEYDHARFLLSVRDRESAMHWLRRAMDRYARLGASTYIRRMERDLGSAGIRLDAVFDGAPRLSHLNERERTAVDFALQGLTNQETAKRMYLSVKTVEYHLGRAYAKLGVRSRRQLWAMAEASR